MFFVLSKLFDVFLSPFTWALGLVIASVFVKPVRVRRGLALGAVALLYVFSTGAVASRLERASETPTVRTVRDDVTYDVVIVLGGMVDDAATEQWGTPAYNEDIERLLTAFDLLRTGRARNAILSSGVGHLGAGLPEADVLVEQLVAWGIDRSRLLPERISRNTYENAVESKKVVEARGFHDALMITSAFHMPRALGCFRAVGLPVDVLPVDFRSGPGRPFYLELVPRAGNLSTSDHVLRELAGRLVYRLRGYSK